MSDTPASPQPARRIAVLLEYDGTAYKGSQYQENGPSIQAELERALASLTGEITRAALAGRTDAGVHALGQVAAFDSAFRGGGCEFERGLNHFLPADIVVLAAREAPATFDPRRDATGRTYRYVVVNRHAPLALERNRAWVVERPLDIAAMQLAAAQLVGRHDFAAFAGPYDGDTCRTLRSCDVSREGDRIVLTMKAKAFLPHQVRRTAGALVEVGIGRSSADALVTLLQEAHAASAGPTAPACGLYLAGIQYDGFDFVREAGREA